MRGTKAKRIRRELQCQHVATHYAFNPKTGVIYADVRRQEYQVAKGRKAEMPRVMV